ncbi:site-specific integrase [Acuticoccus sp. I52.16.1]|uniref:tyrosine-type recombinase/integrase n=1 Tax=Acuticoccus sp. I52.16.1 TaxID=2928472 RepID=UPI001FCF9FFE|nr:site-specific integrase [Acuticoccus sp. I52.16.1]UOM34872.1 tyrosine-type recombinase/integrase [Acuticoccus sp. I52.16.1]
MAVFTNNFLKGLKPGAQSYEERDGGCPGLVIRVGQRGKKVFEVVVSEGKRRRRVRLGTFPDTSLATARRLAADAKAAPTEHVGGRRVADLWDAYAAERKDVLRSWKDVEMVWRQWAEPQLGNVRIEDLTLHHGARLVERVARESSPNRARKVIRYISPMLTFAAGRGMIPGNPWAGLSLPDGSEARDRVLTRKEWDALAEWAREEAYPWGPFVLALMATAQRLSDVSEMRWSEIDGDVWTIPAGRHKSKQKHEVPLPAPVASLLDNLTRHDDFVFSTHAGKSIWPGSKLVERIQAATETAGWRYHDIRRTGATMMSEAGVPRFIIERVLGHTDRTVTAVYDRHTYRAEKRDALARLAATVTRP